MRSGLRDLGVPFGDAASRPRLGGFDQPAAEDVELGWAERRDLSLLTLGEESIGDSPLIEDLDGP